MPPSRSGHGSRRPDDANRDHNGGEDGLAYARLLERTAEATDRCETLEAAARVALVEICTFTGWPVGHLFTRNDGGAPAPTSVWHLDDADRFAAFRQVTETLPSTPEQGLPGRIFASSRPAWIADLETDLASPQADAAAAVGLRTGFGFPVRVGNEAVAVLEFFTTGPDEADPAMLEVIASVGAQLGRVVERQRTVSALRQSEERLRTLARTYERQLAERALRDHLTGLPNRALLVDRLELALARAVRNG